MGNSPSIPGLGGGRTHVRRDNITVGSDRGRRPEQSQMGTIDIQLLEDLEEEEIDDRRDEVNVLEPPVSHSCGRPTGYFTHMTNNM